MTLPSDPTLLCREAEDWADTLLAAARRMTPTDFASAPLYPRSATISADEARSLASLLSQLATLARAQACRT